jgi:hypothetical protein
VMRVVYDLRHQVRPTLVLPSVQWRATASPVMTTDAGVNNGAHQ